MKKNWKKKKLKKKKKNWKQEKKIIAIHTLGIPVVTCSFNMINLTLAKSEWYY